MTEHVVRERLGELAAGRWISGAGGYAGLRNPLHIDEMRRLVARLPPAQEPFLLHLLTCPVCRDLAVVELFEERTGGIVGPYPSPCEVVTFPRDLLERLAKRDQEVEALAVELLALDHEIQLQTARQETRFHRLDLIALLLETSLTRVPREPKGAEEIALLAVAIVHCLDGQEEGRVLAMLETRAWCLVGSSRRLRGDAGAEQAFDKAALFLACPFESSDRGRFCRALAVLRWEQGRLEEAAALLRHGAESFAMLGLVEEEGICLALLGLLYCEQGDTGTALSPLQRARLVIDPARLGWLALRSGLALAFSWADLGQGGRARRTSQESLRLRELVKHPAELLVSFWMEARVGTRLGTPEARELLESVRRKLAAADLFPETALSSFDLALLLARSKESAGIDRLVEEVETTFAGREGLAATRKALLRLRHEAEGETDLRTLEVELALFLRRSFRFHGYRVEPLPFV